MTKRKPNTDWNKAYGDMVRAGRKYLHVPPDEVRDFWEWGGGRVNLRATCRVAMAMKKRPPKGLRIHISEIME